MAGSFRHPVVRGDKMGHDIANATLVNLYLQMLKIRLVELAIEAHYPEREMQTPIHSAIGQEGIAAGVCAQMTREDLVFSTHRSHAHYLAKGGDLQRMIAELYNRETGCARGRGGSMHLIDLTAGFAGSSAIVGGGIALATGAALALLLRKKEAVAIAFFGDGAAEEGVLYESINFAALKKLPVIFICENNLYSIGSPIGNRQRPVSIFKRFQGFEIPSLQVDGNDVEAVYRAAGQVIHQARQGEGPAFIECMTYRMRDHHGIMTGVAAGYQTQEEWDDWARRCPLQRLEDKLIASRVITLVQKENHSLQIQKEIAAAFDFARSSPLPDPAQLDENLYG